MKKIKKLTMLLVFLVSTMLFFIARPVPALAASKYADDLSLNANSIRMNYGKSY